MQNRILLIGGSGLIGNNIKSILKNKLPNDFLLVGGRKKVSENYLEIDVDNVDTFDIIKREYISLVVLCTTDRNNNVLRFCVKNKIDYIDITKPTESLKEAYALARTEEINSKIIFSSGWMGGIIPSLISYNTSAISIKDLKVYIYYSLQDKAGKSSADFMAENASKKFIVYENWKPKLVRHFENPEKYNFIFNSQKYKVYNFDIPDVYILNQIEKIPTVSAKITYNSSFVTKILAIMQRLNIFDRMSLNTRKKLFYSSGNGDNTAFEVVARHTNGTQSRISLLCTAGQAYLTALSTCLHIKKVLNSQLPNQIYFSYQLYQNNEFIDNLKKNEQIKIEIK